MTEAEDSTRVLYQQISASVKKWDFYTTHCSKLSQDPVKPKGAEKDNHSHPHPPLFFGCPTLAYRIPVPQPRTGPRPSAVKVRSPTGPPGSPNHPILTVHWDTSSTAISILSPCPLSYSFFFFFFHYHILSLEEYVGTSLVVQWLRICLQMQGTWVQSLVGEPRFHMLWGN